MSIRENLARRLREIKEELGLSLTEFSEELEISRTLLQAILAGKANPRADTIEHIAKKLKISPISLLAPSPDTQQEDRLVQAVTDHVLIKLKEIQTHDQVLLKMKEILGEKYE